MDQTRSTGWQMTVEEYLAFEAQSPGRHEYVGGVVYAMSGASLRHGRIALNVAAHLRGATRARGCAVVLAEVKVRAARDRFYYPDVLVVCAKAAETELVVDEPSLIVEVSSPSTRATDRREKLDAYLRIPSLRVYLIVDQRRRYVLAYGRDGDGEWRQDELAGAGEIPIGFLDTRLTLDQIYEDVTLPPLSVREGEDWQNYEWADYVGEDG
jgi:Uma2 family endonuclease